MTDHQLSTRDLAARLEGEETGSSLETEQTPERTGDSDSSSQASASSEAETQGASSPDAAEEPLFPTDQRDDFTARWQEIQTSFVDRPRDAVAEADSLVADLMQRLATSFA